MSHPELEKLKETISEFVETGFGPKWFLDDPACSIKLSKRNHQIKSVVIEFFASKLKGEGIFTDILEHLESLDTVIVAENILEKRLIGFFKRRNYLVYSCNDINFDAHKDCRG